MALFKVQTGTDIIQLRSEKEIPDRSLDLESIVLKGSNCFLLALCVLSCRAILLIKVDASHPFLYRNWW